MVVREVSRRLADMGRHEAAAEVLRAADQPEEAVAVAVAGGAWEKARESARGHGQLSEKVNGNDLEICRRSKRNQRCRDGFLGRWQKHALTKRTPILRGVAGVPFQVESAYQQHLMRGEATEELLQMGQTNAALDILAQK